MTGCNRWTYPNWQDEMKAKLRSQDDASSAWVSIERAAWSTEDGRWLPGCVVRKGFTLHPVVRWVKSDESPGCGKDITFFVAQVHCTSSFYRCSFFISGWSLKKLLVENLFRSLPSYNLPWICLRNTRIPFLQSVSSQASAHVCGQYDSGIFGNLAFSDGEAPCSFVTHCLLVNAP